MAIAPASYFSSLAVRHYHSCSKSGFVPGGRAFPTDAQFVYKYTQCILPSGTIYNRQQPCTTRNKTTLRAIDCCPKIVSRTWHTMLEMARFHERMEFYMPRCPTPPPHTRQRATPNTTIILHIPNYPTRRGKNGCLRGMS